MTNKPSRTSESLIWRRIKNLLIKFWASPIAQSVAATLINCWLLIISVLSHFWVVISIVFFCAQTYNTWLVSKGKLASWKALLIGIGLLLINVGLLYLSFLGQFWVVTSIAISFWQYLSLIRVCLRR